MKPQSILFDIGLEVRPSRYPRVHTPIRAKFLRLTCVVHRSMRGVQLAWGPGKRAKFIRAFFRPSGEPVKNGWLTLGEVHFPEPHLGAGLVAHEMFHATLEVMSRAPRSKQAEGWKHEEFLALLNEFLNKRFWIQWLRAKGRRDTIMAKKKMGKGKGGKKC